MIVVVGLAGEASHDEADRPVDEDVVAQPAVQGSAPRPDRFGFEGTVFMDQRAASAVEHHHRPVRDGQARDRVAEGLERPAAAAPDVDALGERLPRPLYQVVAGDVVVDEQVDDVGRREPRGNADRLAHRLAGAVAPHAQVDDVDVVAAIAQAAFEERRDGLRVVDLEGGGGAVADEQDVAEPLAVGPGRCVAAVAVRVDGGRRRRSSRSRRRRRRSA